MLTVSDVARSVRFYTNILGMQEQQFGDGRTAVRFGSQEINFHQSGREIQPNAASAAVGSADLCFLTETPIEAVVRELGEKGVAIEIGPAARTGALGPILSIYLRDPDGNLIEIANQV